MKAVVPIFLLVMNCGCSPVPYRDDSTEALNVAFDCTNGESLNVRFLPAQRLAFLTRNGSTLELPQQPSGSGFIYSNGPNTIRGKGDELIVEIGRMVPLQCNAR